MTPDFHLAELYATRALDGVAHSALPDAPVRPHRDRAARMRRFRLRLARTRVRSTSPMASPGSCAPAR